MTFNHRCKDSKGEDCPCKTKEGFDKAIRASESSSSAAQ